MPAHTALWLTGLAWLGQLRGGGRVVRRTGVVPQAAYVGQGAQGPGALLFGAVGDDAVEDVRRNETVERAKISHQKILI